MSKHVSKYEKIILQGMSIVNEKIGQPKEKFHIENICFWLIPFSIWWWFISDHHFIFGRQQHNICKWKYFLLTLPWQTIGQLKET